MANIVEDDVIKAEMEDGLTQVDQNLRIENFESAFDEEKRQLRIYVKATNKETDETIEINKVLGG